MTFCHSFRNLVDVPSDASGNFLTVKPGYNDIDGGTLNIVIYRLSLYPKYAKEVLAGKRGLRERILGIPP